MEGKEIIINIKLTGDGVVDIKKLKKALSDFTKEQQKNIAVRQKSAGVVKGSEKALRQEIKLLKEGRAGIANTSKQYQVYTRQIIAVEKQLRELTDARRDDVQVNADMISNQGLASASLTEFGRLISDAPFGIIGMTNNISQLGSQLGILSRKTGSAKASFDLLINQLKKGGALILGFQLLISLITFYRTEIENFFKGTASATQKLEEFRKEIKETNQSLTDAAGFIASLERYAEISKDLNSTDEERLSALKKLKEQGYDSLKGSLDEFLEAKRKIAVFNATESILQEEEKIFLQERIKLNRQLADLEEEKNEKIKQGQQLNIEGTLDVTNVKIQETKRLLAENETQINESSQEIVNAFKKTSEELKDNAFYNLFLGTEDESGNGNGVAGKKVTAFGQRIFRAFLGPNFKKLLGKTLEETNDEFFKLQKRILEGTGLSPFEGQKEQMKAMGDEAKNVMNDFLNSERVQKAVAEKEEDDRKDRMLERDLERIEKRKQAQEKLAQEIASGLGKLATIRSQAFQGQITRLNAERDIILNNDNLTAQEKDRLLKENDKKSRQVRIRQIKFERDMFQIEAAMELAKLALQGKTILAGIIGTGAQQTQEATGSIGKFLSQLGPIAGPIAYAAMIGGVIAQIVSARKKAEEQIKALSGPLAGVSSGGSGGGAAIAAPAFNVVGATQTSQLAQTIAGAEDKPLRAYVVASDVTTAQELERSTIEGASIG